MKENSVEISNVLESCSHFWSSSHCAFIHIVFSSQTTFSYLRTSLYIFLGWRYYFTRTRDFMTTVFLLFRDLMNLKALGYTSSHLQWASLLFIHPKWAFYLLICSTEEVTLSDHTPWSASLLQDSWHREEENVFHWRKSVPHIPKVRTEALLSYPAITWNLLVLEGLAHTEKGDRGVLNHYS